ncbi:MAG: FAD-binding oxidoreductase [Caldilineaceae bacterium]
MDFVIIGGGIYGCTVAWELAQLGAGVMVLEAGEVAGGASGGLGRRGVRANGRDLRELPLMRLAYVQWPTLHEAIGGATGYVRTGHLLLIERQRDLVGAPAQAWMQNQQGIETHFLSQSQTRELEPYVSEQVLGALYCPNDGVADHALTTRSMAKAAQKAGAFLREQTRVTAIEQKGNQVSAVITEAEERILVKKALVVLANAGAAALLQTPFALELPLWARLPQIILTAVVEPMPVQHLIGHAHRRLAMKANPDGRVMISGGWLGRWNSATKRGSTELDQVQSNLADARAVYPCLQEVPIQQAAADRWETECADHIPIIDRSPQCDNLYFGAGWSGHGWAIAPALGRLVAEWVFTGKRAPLLQPFAYTRFSQAV